MKKVVLLLVMSCLLSGMSFGQSKFVGAVKSKKVFDNRVEFILDNALFNLYVYDSNVIRFRYTDKNEFSKAPSYAVVYALPAKSDFQLKEDSKEYTLTTKELIVKISKSPCRVSVYDLHMNLLNEDEKSFGVSFDNNEVKCFKKQVEGETFYGLGEQTSDLNKTGKAFSLWNRDNGDYNRNTQELYESIPFYYGIQPMSNPVNPRGENVMIAYGIFFDNTYKSHFNFGASNNRFNWFGAEGGEMDYYFIHGPEIKKVLTSYTQLTGRMQLPPMWGLGYQQCRWAYSPESTLRNVADNFRARKIPCDVLYLDIDYMDGYRVFTWDKTRFPDFPKTMFDLKGNGFKVITIIDPGVKADSNYFVAKEGVKRNLFAKYPDGVLYQGQVWPSWAYFPDFSKQETRSWWGDNISILLKAGVEGIWNDMNEPATWGQDFPDIVSFDDNGFKADHKKIHNVFGLEMAKATREGLRKYSDKRHVVLTRAGFSGIQRYSAIWTGDNLSNEENLKLACTMPLNMGLGGLPYIGSDIGGFDDGPNDLQMPPSQNLYIRWMELGTFAPFFRQHSCKGTNSKEPWNFGEYSEAIVRNTIELRYRLLPFLYNEFYVSTQTGLPIMRPMFMNYQNDKECYALNSQYQFMVGENMLVAPVLSERETIKHVYLPAGDWFELNTNKFYKGNESYIIDVPINMIPMFIREGGMVPMQDVQQYVGEKKIEQTEMIVYPANNSGYSFYEDDGISFDNEKGKYAITDFACTKNGNTEIVVRRVKDGFKPDRKSYLFEVVSDKKPAKVLADDKALNTVASASELSNSASGYYYNEMENTIYIKVGDAGNFKVNINY